MFEPIIILLQEAGQEASPDCAGKRLLLLVGEPVP